MAEVSATPAISFHNFSSLPTEIREQIWRTALPSSWFVSVNDVGPGLWRYQPGCWQARADIELDGQSFKKRPRGSDGHFPTENDTIVFAKWLLSSNTLPRSAVPFVNHEARALALRYFAGHGGKKSQNASRPRKKYMKGFPWDDSSSSDEDDVVQLDRTRARRPGFSRKCDALYIPSENWAECNDKIENILRGLEASEEEGEIGEIHLDDGFPRIAVSLGCLTSNLTEIGRFSAALEDVKELLVIISDTLPPPADAKGQENGVGKDAVWWEFEDAGKGAFVWEQDLNDWGSQGWFEFRQNGNLDVRDEELCDLIKGLEEDLRKTLKFALLSLCNPKTKFQIRPVVAVARKWL